MPSTLCLVCGRNESEVARMHYFPQNALKCSTWLESLGAQHFPSIKRNSRICSNHFREEDYFCGKLKNNCLPLKFFPEYTSSNEKMQLEVSTIVEPHLPMPGPSDSDVPVIADAITSVPGTSATGNTNIIIHQTTVSTPQERKLTVTTPRERKLMKVIASKQTHLRRLKKLAKERGNNIKLLCNLNESAIVKDLFKDMSSKTANFLLSQIKATKKQPKGRRWTIDDKVLALSLLKRGPRCYNFLRKIVPMPSKKTLLNLLKQVPFKVGINIHMLEHINVSLKTVSDRVCAIVFDEMDIKEHVQYDSHTDTISGYGEKLLKPANKALVFMLKGLHYHWKQPIAYFFSTGPISGTDLSIKLVEVIETCQRVANVNIVATINDCGTNNTSALKKLGSSSINPYIVVGGKHIFTIFDPPHLLKSSVSLFRKYDIELEVESLQNALMHAKFSDIRKAHTIDSTSPLIFRAMHKIKAHHMEPKLKFAMKVNLAAQIMSRTVSSFLYTLLSRGELEQRSIATATLVHQVDELFDSFNGSCKRPPSGKKLKCMISNESSHTVYWPKAYKMVSSWRYLRKTKSGGFKTSKPPSQIGWLTTIKGIEGLWNYLQNKEHFQSLKPRILNQDAIENLFGAIRSGLGCNDNPTTLQFVGSLKTQILNGLINFGAGTNCEEDDGILLSNLRQYLTIDPVQPEQSSEEVVYKGQQNVELLTNNVADAINTCSTGSLSVAYVGGFIVKRILQSLECQMCKSDLLGDSQAPQNVFIAFKEWADGENHLIYPAEAPIVSLGIGISLLENFLEAHSNMSNLSRHIESLLEQKIHFEWIRCSTHREFIVKSFIKGVWKIGIPWWCKRKNRQIANEKQLTKNKKIKKFKHL